MEWMVIGQPKMQHRVLDYGMNPLAVLIPVGKFTECLHALGSRGKLRREMNGVSLVVDDDVVTCSELP